MPDWARLQQAYDGGTLPAEKRVAYEQAIQRGLVPEQFLPQMSKAGPEEFLGGELRIPLGKGFGDARVDVPQGVEKLMVGAGRGITDIGQGVQQMMHHGQATSLRNSPAGAAYAGEAEQAQSEYNTKVDADIRRYEDAAGDDLTMGVGRFGGQIAATAMVPGAGQARGVRALTKAMASGTTAAGMTATKEGESRLANMGYGAVGGTVGQGVLMGLTKVGSRLINAARGKFGSNAVAELDALTKEYGLPLTAGDVSGNATLQKIDDLLERVPFVGLGGARRKAAERATRIATELVDAHKPQTAAASARESVIEAVSRARNKGEAAVGGMYDEIVAAAGDTQFPTNHVARAAQDAIDAIKAQGDITKTKQRVIDALQEYAQPRSMTWSGIKDLRTEELSELVANATSQTNSDIPRSAARYMRKLYEAATNDMGDAARSLGDDVFQKWQSANSAHIRVNVPWRDDAELKAIASAIERGSDGNILGSILGVKKGPVVRKLMGMLDEDGQQALRFAILDDAFQRATVDGQFSPKAFSSWIRKHRPAINEAFEGEDREMLGGIVNLMRAAQRSVQFAERNPTGSRYVDATIFGAGVGAGAMADITTTGGIGVALLGLRSALTSATGKRLLLAASKATPSSKALQETWGILARSAALAAASLNDES